MRQLVAGASQNVFEEDWGLNHPHPPIIDGDILGGTAVGFGLVLG